MLSIILFIFKMVFTLAYNLLDALPTLDFTIPVNLFDNIVEFFNGVAFFIPMAPILVLFELKLLVIQFRIFWALCMRVKSFIPTISGG
ncbi:MAG: hypothetical protein E7505_04610 [Ruminococcus sp.]|nr:hypothetical protein [Ruminococcus sp.]